MNKRAQITAIIIIGIVFLISVILIVYYYNSTKEKTTEQEAEKITKVPEWAKPVNENIKNCMEKVSLDGFKKIGEHGGYIDIKDAELSGKKFSLNENPTESDAVKLSKKDNDGIAYWWYMEGSNKCADCYMNSMMPSLNEIEQQMNRYIRQQLRVCINDFQDFRKEGYNFETKDITAATSIALDDVSISVNYPVTIKKDASAIELSDFYINLDLKFREIYELAASITANEMENQYLEKILTDLIVAYSSTSRADIPPIAWIDRSYHTTTWNEKDVENKLKRNILGGNMLFIQINNTKDAKPVIANTLLGKKIYSKMFLDFLPKKYESETVNFIYNPSWGIYVDVTPSKKDILGPSTEKINFWLNIMPPKQTNYYEFFYDVSFPVVIMIRDHSSLKSKGENGYTFMFALEGNIRDNKNLLEWNQGKGTIGEWDYSKIAVSMKNTKTEMSVCINESANQWKCLLTGKVFSNEVNCKIGCYNTSSSIEEFDTSKGSLFCNENQRISGEITINVLNNLTKEKIDNALISYGCGNYKSCSIGLTNENGTFKGKFPVCIGSGYIYVDKDSYITETLMPVSAIQNVPQKFDIYLKPLYEKNVEVAYIKVDSLLGLNGSLLSDLSAINSYKQNAKILGDNESAIITITRVKKNPNEKELPAPIINVNKNSNQTMQIASGSYEVRIMFIDEKEVIIPAKEIYKVKIPEVKYKPSYIALEIYNETRYFTVDEDKLRNSKTIRFYFLRFENPKTIEEMGETSNIKVYTSRYRNFLEPDFIIEDENN